MSISVIIFFSPQSLFCYGFFHVCVDNRLKQWLGHWEEGPSFPRKKSVVQRTVNNPGEDCGRGEE